MTRAALLVWFVGRQLTLLARDRQFMFWNVVFFAILLVLFLGVLSGGDAAVRVTLAAAVVTTGVMANGIFSVGVGLTSARERGIFRRYGSTPAPGWLPVSATIIARAIVVCAAAAVQVGIAAAFGVSWSGGVASWVAIIVMGTAAFTGIGFLIAASARAPHVANTMANLVFMPMLALGGTALPASMMPQAWAHVHQVLPAATIFDGLLGAFVRGESVGDNLPRLGYLAAWALVTFAAAGYRWTRRGMTP